jgi:hypothetical protein
LVDAVADMIGLVVLDVPLEAPTKRVSDDEVSCRRT